MKVKHLIEKLKKADPEAEVILEDNIIHGEYPENDDDLMAVAWTSPNGFKSVTLYFTDMYKPKHGTEL